MTDIHWPKLASAAVLIGALIFFALYQTKSGPFTDPFAKCSKRLGVRSTFDISGSIYGPVGEKAEIRGCGRARVSVVFIGLEAEGHKQLFKLASEQVAVAHYTGRAHGFLVREGSADFILLINNIDDFRRGHVDRM